MNLFKKILLCILCAILCLDTAVFASAFEIKDAGIQSITIPDEYMACSREVCDEKLQNLLAGNRYSFANWVKNVMEPGNYYIYACKETNLSDCIYLSYTDIPDPQTAVGQISHRLAADYNMIDDGDDINALTELKPSGKWIDGTSYTPYVEYSTLIGNDYCHCYETVYCGKLITLQFSSKRDFSDSQKDEHRAILDTIVYQEEADYTDLKAQIAQTVQKKLEDETHSGENTKIIRLILSASLVPVIAFAIYMAIRSQNKKRKKTIVLREPEIINKDAKKDTNED